LQSSERKQKKKLNVVLKTNFFMLFENKRYCPLVKIIGGGGGGGGGWLLFFGEA
jgi:hypothetical protein